MLEQLIYNIIIGGLTGVTIGAVFIGLAHLYAMIQYKRGKRGTGSHYEFMQEIEKDIQQTRLRTKKLQESIDKKWEEMLDD